MTSKADPLGRENEAVNGRDLRESLSAGFTWLALGTITNKGINLIAQLALGRLLLPTDFGLYAAAASITLLVRSLQDAGVREVIVQAGKDDFLKLRGPVFWMSTLLNVMVGLGLFVAAPWLSFLYEGRVVPLLQVIAFWIMISSPWAFFSAALSREMRFAALALLNVGWAVIQFGGTVLLALRGFGPISFVLPLPFASMSMAMVAYLLCREQPWLLGPRIEAWRELLSKIKWLAVGRVAFALFSQGDFMILAATVSPTVLGVYYFAYQLPGQFVGLLSNNLHAVLFPAFARMTGPTSKRATNVKLMAGVLTVGVSLFCGSIIVAIAPLETLFWGGRWQEAVIPIQVLSVALPFRALFDVSGALLLADGRFRFLALLQTIQGVGLMIVAGASGTLLGSPTPISVCVAGYLLVSGLIFSALAIGPLGVPARALLNVCLPVWVGSLICAGLVLVGVSTVSMGYAAEALLRVVLYLIAFVLLLRLVLTGLMKDTISVLPHGMRSKVQAVMLIK